MRRASLLVVLLIAATVTTNFGLQQVKAITIQATSPVNFTIIADVEAWNSTVLGCTSGTPNCNPTVTEFRSVAFTAQVNWGDCCTHDFAIYTAGSSSADVSPFNNCTTTNPSGCLARSSSVSSTTTPRTLSFSPTIPRDDFTGTGTYEYFCEFHPNSMHGKFKLYKNPDIDNNGVVNIVDVATVAFSFGATPTSSNWNVATDLDNNGVVNILDVALDAFYFGQPI